MSSTGKDVSLSLADFVEQYDLPCTVMVTRGYSCGDADEDDSLSQGEIITLHSVQQDQVRLVSNRTDMGDLKSSAFLGLFQLAAEANHMIRLA